jgi:hypothetical protein
MQQALASGVAERGMRRLGLLAGRGAISHATIDLGLKVTEDGELNTAFCVFFSHATF